MAIKTVRHDSGRALRMAEKLDIAIRSEETFEDEAVGCRREPALGGKVETSRERRGRIVQTAAMGGVDHFHSLPLALQFAAGDARIGSALGAMSVQHVDTEFRGEPCDLGRRAPVAQSHMARHGHAREPEHASIVEPAELHGNLIAARAQIAHDAHLGSELGLAEREVMHMAEQAPQ